MQMESILQGMRAYGEVVQLGLDVYFYTSV